ncbi:MAG TPA: methionyl-tRNA formyltransferase [Jatrophihabitans sp.]|jgi:methionyl-tRNA formyltransferase
MRLLFAGTPSAAVPSLRALLAHPDHEVVAVLTRPDAPSGRGRTIRPSPVAEVAREAGVEILSPAKPTDPDFLARAAELEIDCCPVVAYGALLREPALSLPRHGWVNLHFSLLPSWRGAAPVQAALLHGDELTGASTFLIGPGLDDGPVYGVLTEQIRPTDTSGELLNRLAEAGAGLLVATMDGIADGSLQPVEQSSDGVSHAPKLTSSDAHIDFDRPAIAVDRRVRACTPAPGAWASFRGERVRLAPVRPDVAPDGSPAPDGLKPGVLAVTKRAVYAGTATGPVRLTEVQAPGKRMMVATDWARGARIEAGERFGD